MKVTESLRAFLKARQTTGNADLVARWSSAMETQVNVAADNGEPVDGKRGTYTDGVNEWFSIRIPHGAYSEPAWKDFELRWPLDLHAEAIGATGWNWVDRCSEWAGFDVDSLVSHAAGVGITDEALEEVKKAATSLSYVEVRRSTGGKGLHLYVRLDNIPTKNHTEHAALARCVLGMMSSECNFDFASQIDCCGGNMWIWHRKLKENGLALLKPSTKVLTEADLPSNWRDHIEVVTRQRTRVKIAGVDDQDPIEALASSRRKVPLDATHKTIIEELSHSGFSTVWLPDHHLLQTHTKALESLIGYKGTFKTISAGKDKGTCNCFAFPLDEGAWRVYRFSRGTNEAETWSQDGDGWTNCAFNKTPNLTEAALANGGVEGTGNKGFYFSDAEAAATAIRALGHEVQLPDELLQREARLKAQPDGRVAIYVAREGEEPAPKGWLAEKKQLTRVLNIQAEIKAQVANESYSENDKLIRSLNSTADRHIGFVARDESGAWVDQPKDNARSMLLHHGFAKPEADVILGSACYRAWKTVNLPFQPEYPGNRQWNRHAAQFACQPTTETPSHPHWDLVFKHCFGDLDAAIRDLPWAQRANIRTGADYGTLWAASLLRDPFQPLPYLFFYGNENCGKSTFHEAFEFLMTSGIKSAYLALTNQNNFNGELEGAILAVVEELDISRTPGALGKIKDWVLSPTLLIRRMRTDAYTVANTLHFIQVSNHPDYCPIFPGDTRITMIFVPPLPGECEIPRNKLRDLLEEEAPHFLRTLLDVQLPTPEGRLRIPIVETHRKTKIQSTRRDPLNNFLLEICHPVVGEKIPFGDFYDRFLEWMPPDERPKWRKSRVGAMLPEEFPYGRATDNKYFVGNLSWKPGTPVGPPLILVGDRLRVQE